MDTLHHAEHTRTEMTGIFQQIDKSLHKLLDYLDPATPDFDANVAVVHLERFTDLQRRHSLAIASHLAKLSDLQESPDDRSGAPATDTAC